VFTNEQIARNYEVALDTATKFFMGTADVQKAARRIARALEELEIAYAICGGLAVAAHGHVRVTADVDVLLRAEGLQRFKDRWLGRGWVEQFSGSRGMKDVEHGVNIDVVLTGDFPGDGKPAPVAFPDPATVAIDVGDGKIVSLPALIDLKLASGMTAPHRLQDFADVIALVRANALPLDLADDLNAYVREKYRELWQHAQAKDERR
jgi:hypothetical protein